MSSVFPSPVGPATTAKRGTMSAADKAKLDAVTGTNTGDVALGAVGTTPASEGASLAGQVLTLQPADATRPGVLTTGAQTIGGVKTLTGAILAGVTTITEAVTALVRAVGVSLVLRSSLGGASDVGVKLGTSVAAGSVVGGFKPFSIRYGLGGTEVEHVYVDAYGNLYVNVQGNGSGSQAFYAYAASGGKCAISAQGGGAATDIFRGTQDFVGTTFGVKATGRVDQKGTDSSAAPGAKTADRAAGKNAIALGASSVVITNSLVTAASVVLITPHARDATCKELIAVPAAGSFTVSGIANATADLPFSWEVKGLI